MPYKNLLTTPIALLVCVFSGPALLAQLAAPDGLSASEGLYDDMVLLTWSPVMSALNYDLWRGETDDPGQANLLAQSHWVTSYMDSEVVPGTIYFYWVGASDGWNRGPLSESASGYAGTVAGENYTITIAAENGRVNRSPDLPQYDAGTAVILTPVPEPGFRFSKWSGDASGGANPLTVTVNSDLQITAVFAGSTATAGSLQIILQPPEAVTLGAQWRLTSDTQWQDSRVTLSDLPFGNHQVECKPVAGWTTPSPLTIPLASNLPNVTWTLSYEPASGDTYAILIETENGRVDRVPEQASYAPGTMVQLTAVPDPGFEFSHWAGDASGSANPLSITLDADKTVSAVFQAIVEPTVNATHQAGNYASPGSLTVHCEFHYPVGQQLLSLGWRPSPPAGWTLASASGTGSPEVQQDGIVFTGALAENPIPFSYILTVPADQSGVRQIQGVAEYQLAGMINPAEVPAAPDPLEVRADGSGGEAPALSLAMYAGIRISGTVGASYQLQFTHTPEAPESWIALDSVTLQAPQELWFDVESGEDPTARFYRAVLVE
jgi:hypothetical protein